VVRPILFLTDYGLEDEYVGVCHAVLARMAPDAPVIDVTHGIPPRDVLAGALALAAAALHAPHEAVYLAVVDPGVGTDRRAVALQAGGALLVGPDNGVLGLAAGALGGVTHGVAIEAERVARGPVSATFHGRDVFAPAAALLASGASLGDLGPEIDPSTLVSVEPEEPLVGPGRLGTSVLGVDRFGNLRLAARPEHLGAVGLGDDLVLLSGADPVPLRRVRTFEDLGEEEIGLLEDSGGWLAVVRNGGSAARSLELGPHSPVILAAAADAIG
jgi:S-adenosyl-L-methionine hydrolase (adenosine-forming)